MPIVVLVFGLVVTTVGVLQWKGLLGQSRHVDALAERAYLGVPTGMTFTGFGVLFLVDEVAFVRSIAVPVSLLLLGLAALGLALMLARPRAIRPRWQQALVERDAPHRGGQRGSQPGSTTR